ncbi:GL26595 [Drosophila persimilis]|uniref:GL26595 n=1 Tax=Drosophila persimilis TaxID=7234 RepID=B4GST1_DROPE|nr:uncharacterized protein LOC6596412 [Drosophila persimilis]EDW25440.1 GL26595 [Drosophila persimilis]
MSEPGSSKDLPGAMEKAQVLRQEISRSSREISFNFWQEFERIRAVQMQRLLQERQERERISKLMVAANAEAHQLTEALSRSIVTQGVSLETLPQPAIANKEDPGAGKKTPAAPQPATDTKRPLHTGVGAVAAPSLLPQRLRAQNQRLQMANKPKAPPKPILKPAARPPANRGSPARVGSAPVSNRTPNRLSANPQKGAKLSGSKTTPDIAKSRLRKTYKKTH